MAPKTLESLLMGPIKIEYLLTEAAKLRERAPLLPRMGSRAELAKLVGVVDF